MTLPALDRDKLIALTCIAVFSMFCLIHLADLRTMQIQTAAMWDVCKSR